MTHGSDLKVRVLRSEHDSLNGKLHLVTLTNHSGAEPFDVGKSITVMAAMGPAKVSGSADHGLFFLLLLLLLLFLLLLLLILCCVTMPLLFVAS